MTSEAVQQTPVQQLAAQIADVLCRQKLIPQSKKDELQGKLERGRVSPDDWRLYIEMAVEANQGGQPDASKP